MLKIIVPALVLCGSVAQAQEAVSVMRGDTIRLQSWAYFNGQCKRTGLPRYSTLTTPKLGTVSASQGQITIRRVAEDKMKNCIGKSVTGTVVTYTAGSKAGTDRLSIGRKRQGGDIARTDFVITVK